MFHDAERAAYWALGLGIALLALMISGQSLWIDEADTAIYALQPDFSAWLKHLLGDTNADCQMPLTMFLAWALKPLLGTSEWALRLPNLAWGLGTLLAARVVGRDRKLPWLPLVFALQPYFWFYTGEARPFAAQICAGTWLMAGMQRLWLQRGESSSAVIMIAGSIIVLAHLTLLAPVAWLAVGAVTLAMMGLDRWQLPRRAWGVLGGAVVACLPIGAYYLGTVLRGAKGAQLWEVGWKNLAYTVYELGGMTGLGPPVRVIREAVHGGNLVALWEGHALGWALMVAAAVVGLGWAFRLGCAPAWVKSPEGVLCLAGLGVAAVGGGLLFASGMLLEKAFWARHWAPLFPWMVLALSLAGAKAWRMGGPLGRAGLILILAVWGLSAAQLRWNPAHGKDDYRAAAAQARAALEGGETVWWCGSWHAAAYYGLPVTLDGRFPDPRFIDASFLPAGAAEALPPPDCILITKPENFDRQGAIAGWLKVQAWGPPEARSPRAFKIYRKADASTRNADSS